MEQMSKFTQSLDNPEKNNFFINKNSKEFEMSLRRSQEPRNWATIEPEERKVDLSKYLNKGSPSCDRKRRMQANLAPRSTSRHQNEPKTRNHVLNALRRVRGE
jgi:hypothetical protein